MDGVEDRLDVLERLEELYKQLGMTEEASEAKREMEAEKKKEEHNRITRREELLQVPRKTAAPKSKKIGRNEPCPCGSGKKYKKCCGR
ncbi:SEC-C metal-binding domain-containing protein [Siminovitchia sp. 179-K 8D1 HS]|uniref:SEC-C metal-binding domain-containing protein n=1 Tax=Siminovitchia sp. 179-K 8D1 HS TaxID=3142385 RepID=UPI0039A2582C